MSLPNCTVAWRDAVVGGICAAIAFELAKRGFGYYVRRIPTYTAVYGAFAAVPLFLLWMYLSWLITLAGAMVASALPVIRIGQFHRVDYPGSDLLDALALLARLADAQEAGKPGHSAARLAVMVRCGMETAQRLLSAMEDREWVARLEGGDIAVSRYVLLANPERLTVSQLFDAFVVDRDELLYQVQRGRPSIDGERLVAALSGERQGATLAQLLVRRGEALAEELGEQAGAAAAAPPKTA